jgi:hypothetical protein
MFSITPLDCTGPTLARLLLRAELVLAVGTGDPTWPADAPAHTGSEIALLAPAAIVRCRTKEYVSPVATPAAGDVTIPDPGDPTGATLTHWRVSPTPTAHVALVFKLGYGDGAALTLREEAIYVDPDLTGVAPGLSFVPWADVTAPGWLLGALRGPPLVRQGTEDSIIHILTL